MIIYRLTSCTGLKVFSKLTGTGHRKADWWVVPDDKTECYEVQHDLNYAGFCVCIYVRCASDEQNREFYLRSIGTIFIDLEGRYQLRYISRSVAPLPRRTQKIFFRAGSDYLNRRLFYLLEDKGHDDLVKFKY